MSATGRKQMGWMAPAPGQLQQLAWLVSSQAPTDGVESKADLYAYLTIARRYPAARASSSVQKIASGRV
jgi:hypothetical protein